MQNREIKHTFRDKWVTPTVWGGLFAATYLAVLPMAGTMALRNVALLCFLLVIAWELPKIRRYLQFGLPVLVWAVYLCLFPLIADDHATAWKSFFSEWGRGLLVMFAGASAAVLLKNSLRGAVFYLGVMSALPVLIHLALFIAKTWTTGSMPWGYWGREVHHADLGYASGHTVVLMTAAIFSADKKYRPFAIVFIIAALLSTALARSRAGLAFAVLGALFVMVPVACTLAKLHIRGILIGLISLGLLTGAIFTVVVKDDSRWHTMASNMSAGLIGNALTIECEGTSSIEEDVLAKYGSQEAATQIVSNVRNGDGARVVLIRAGLELVLQHPFGSDGSRQAFQKLLKQTCPIPAILMAHTHNGWIDTSLAIGLIGSILYFSVFFHYFRMGMKGLRDDGYVYEWAIVLMALPVFWIIRGFVDSVFRDHMLEMQGFLLAFAATAFRLQLKSK